MIRHVTATVALLAAGTCVVGCTSRATAQTVQEHVHSSAHTVMPFDMTKTVPAKEQVALIQQHLKHEAERFQRGDYSDPGMLHGKDMPGLKELQTGGSKIKVSYLALPEGAEISFSTDDRHLLTAIHRWFGAQLSEHGADAKAE